ncbi:MAG: tRNA lysidine(34) synthetase TilS [Candidatus Contendobacter odensis]|uniref:tRNA(Ile)-lysidine synthase n=1 Tax=Candidatus Contendibacter odensensis TaxID=1400860 RepID=A0A2G6PDW3_9GAMM|nr:MAG: tRNA lysidine(34) synthetase TilS [Candidatus Contendobacter odensis]
MDSHVLLHYLATHQAQWRQQTLEAIYVDHGLHVESAAWAKHCADICQALHVPFRVLKVDARPTAGESPEATARQVRYAALTATLKPDTALLTAHHRDDQAETLLLQLLRGAGVHGLAAMPAATQLGQGWLLRPMLSTDHTELHAYAHHYRLHWIEDASNTNTLIDRNYLRHRVLPLLRERWPAANCTLARSALWCAEAAAWLDADAITDLNTAISHRPDGLLISSLRTLNAPRQRNLIRYWLRRLGIPIPDTRQLTQLIRDMLGAAPDRQPCVRWLGGETRRYRDILYAMPPIQPHDRQGTFTWYNVTGHTVLNLPNLGQLHWQKTTGTGLPAKALRDTPLTVCFRQGGERFRPAGRHHTQTLKKLFQEAAIPPWERNRLPLLYRDNVLLAVVGLGTAADYSVAPHETGWQAVLESPSAMVSGIV